jgi:hypothetical protein
MYTYMADEDIDQYFSVISRHFKVIKGAYTYTEFVTEINKSFKTRQFVPRCVNVHNPGQPSTNIQLSTCC